MGPKMMHTADGDGRQQQESGTHTFRVLLADDDLEFRKMLACYLRRQGFEVVECSDGYCLEKHLGLTDLPNPADRFDVVIADNRMPGPSGLQVLKASAKSARGVPFILITAFADETTRTDAQHLGAAQVLSKPFDIDDLISEVCQIAPMGLFISSPSSFSKQGSGDGPSFPLDITYRHHSGSGYITTIIQHYAAKLNPYSKHIGACRVVVECMGQTRQPTTRYRVSIHLATDVEPVVVEHDSDMGPSFENLYMAIKHAFHAAGRRLKHELGKRRHNGHHKAHRSPAIHQ